MSQTPTSIDEVLEQLNQQAFDEEEFEWLDQKYKEALLKFATLVPKELAKNIAAEVLKEDLASKNPDDIAFPGITKEMAEEASEEIRSDLLKLVGKKVRDLFSSLAEKEKAINEMANEEVDEVGWMLAQRWVDALLEAGAKTKKAKQTSLRLDNDLLPPEEFLHLDGPDDYTPRQQFACRYVLQWLDPIRAERLFLAFIERVKAEVERGGWKLEVVVARKPNVYFIKKDTEGYCLVVEDYPSLHPST